MYKLVHCLDTHTHTYVWLVGCWHSAATVWRDLLIEHSSAQFSWVLPQIPGHKSQECRCSSFIPFQPRSLAFAGKWIKSNACLENARVFKATRHPSCQLQWGAVSFTSSSETNSYTKQYKRPRQSSVTPNSVRDLATRQKLLLNSIKNLDSRE